MSWLIENKEWLFSGAGLAALGLIYKFIYKKEDKPISENNNSIVINNNPPHNNTYEKEMHPQGKSVMPNKTLEDYKNSTRILFVDDDQKFKVAKILVKSGWVHTKLIKDIGTLDQQDVSEASILFVDVQGVGVAMGFQDEGLGLALAIKDKYPQKTCSYLFCRNSGRQISQSFKKSRLFPTQKCRPL